MQPNDEDKEKENPREGVGARDASGLESSGRGTGDQEAPGEPDRGEGAQPGGVDAAGSGTPGGAVVGEPGRLDADQGAADVAGDAALDPRADAERLAEKVRDALERDDEGD